MTAEAAYETWMASLGERPALILSASGAILHASPGARALRGLRLTLDGATHRITAEAFEDAPFGPRAAWEDVELRDARGLRRARVERWPVPLDGPAERWVWLFDLGASASSAAEGLPLGAERPGDAVCEHGLWTRSAEMKALFRTLEQVAPTDVTVLVRGESGTGKEHIARAVHSLSKRAARPFVAVNCAALTPSLLESELFGHVKGAFTGALKTRAGLFEQADGGTIFLDEVAEMPLELQSKLLRVLQEREVTPVGGNEPKRVDVRVVSATHRSLRRAVAEGRFRQDLMFRLRVVPVFLPALRERRGDIELLTSVFLEAQAAQGRKAFERVDPEAMRALLDHPWPGNVRELRNVMEYAAAVSVGATLTLADLPPEFRDPSWPPAPPELNARAAPEGEAAELQRLLDDCGGRKGEAAERLGVHRTTLWRKLKQHGLA